MCPRRAIRNCCRGGRIPEGQSVPERRRAYRWLYSAGEAYERVGVDCDHVLPRSRSPSDSGRRVTTPTVEPVGAAAAVYRPRDQTGSGTAAVSAPTSTAGVAAARAGLASSEEMTRI